MENPHTEKALNYYRDQFKAIIKNQYLGTDEMSDHLKLLHTDIESMKISEDSKYHRKSENLLNDIERYIDILM